jgi:hypothetical protein
VGPKTLLDVLERDKFLGPARNRIPIDRPALMLGTTVTTVFKESDCYQMSELLFNQHFDQILHLN